jgi:hypothetical protein
MSLTPENSSTGWLSFGERFITPENSSTGWLGFGGRFNDRYTVNFRESAPNFER